MNYYDAQSETASAINRGHGQEFDAVKAVSVFKARTGTWPNNMTELAEIEFPMVTGREADIIAKRHGLVRALVDAIKRELLIRDEISQEIQPTNSEASEIEHLMNVIEGRAQTIKEWVDRRAKSSASNDLFKAVLSTIEQSVKNLFSDVSKEFGQIFAEAVRQGLFTDKQDRACNKIIMKLHCFGHITFVEQKSTGRGKGVANFFVIGLGNNTYEEARNIYIAKLSEHIEKMEINQAKDLARLEVLRSGKKISRSREVKKIPHWLPTMAMIQQLEFGNIMLDSVDGKYIVHLLADSQIWGKFSSKDEAIAFGKSRSVAT